MDYSAKQSYQSGSEREEYERERFSGVLGRYRRLREQRAVSSLVLELPTEVSIADCPCGNGRWWPLLTQRASHLIAIDISAGMLRIARKEAKKHDIKIEVVKGDAESLELEDESVDYVFSYALTKHLPVPIQYEVLSEFSRIARRGVICSFGVFSHVTYEFWRFRRLVESYPVFIEELEWMAKNAGLGIRKLRRCSTPIGVEHIVLFERE